MRLGEVDDLDLSTLRGIIDAPELSEILNRVAASLRGRVLQHGAAFETTAPGFGRRFVAPFRAIARIEFGEVQGGAAYKLVGSVMTISYPGRRYIGEASRGERDWPACPPHDPAVCAP